MKIVYHSFEGRFSDNPRALYEALVAEDGHTHLWLADDAHRDGFPPDVETVRYGSPEGLEALESADLLVANTHTDLEWRKPEGAIYLQTWHGTPLKRIHHDVLWAPEGRMPRLDRDVAKWDLLLSPNRPTTDRLRGAFRYDGEILESGYPRNDVLSSPGRDAIRARVRRELGIADDVTAVLYTPTWRDDVVFEEGGKAFALDLDVEAFTEALGTDHVLLLRLHYMLTGRFAAARHDAVRDVSFHPQVADLYLAADVLLTDYSSTMFDFAVTGRPILLHTPDLDDFANRLRGFYFDLAEAAPGPLLETTGEVIEALRDLPAVTAANADRYARFRTAFCHLEDGRATERVLARLRGAVG